MREARRRERRRDRGRMAADVPSRVNPRARARVRLVVHVRDVHLVRERRRGRASANVRRERGESDADLGGDDGARG
jgi:hypothetical protein